MKKDVKATKKDQQMKCEYIDGSWAFDRISYSLVTPLSRQTQSDGLMFNVFIGPFMFNLINIKD